MAEIFTIQENRRCGEREYTYDEFGFIIRFVFHNLNHKQLCLN